MLAVPRVYAWAPGADPMLRTVAGVIVGMIVGMIVNMAIIEMNTALYPMPDGVSMDDLEAFKQHVATLPVTALLIIMAAHLGQAFVGGLVAAFISKQHKMGAALTVGGLSMMGGIMMMLMIEDPAWMWIEMPLYLVAAWAAAKLAMRCCCGCNGKA